MRNMWELEDLAIWRFGDLVIWGRRRANHAPVSLRAGGAVSALLAGLLLIGATGCSHREPAAVESASNPDYLQFISLRDKLSEEPNNTHTIAIEGVDGKTWYREADIGANLADVRLGEVYVAPADPADAAGPWTLTLRFREESIDRLSAWCEPRMGRLIGMLIDGKLVYVEPMDQSLVGRVRFLLPMSESEIGKVRRRIRAGGAE
ncbi:MAG: hypothetical protein KDA32_02520 [Phycisphaerales bacterium]|nr:hypothetical protein [Phycisphaerales bacterium]